MNQFTPPPNLQSQQDPLFPGFPTLDVAGIFKALKDRFWLMAGIFGAFVFAAVVYALMAPKVYESSATVEVETKRSGDLDSTFDASKIDLDRLNSLAANITNNSAIIHVVDSLGLRDDPDFLKPVEGGYSDADLVDALYDRISSELIRGERRIIISVKDKDPVRAQRLAMGFVAEAELSSIRSGGDRSAIATEMLEKALEKQRARVAEAENAVQTFREKYPTLRLDDTNGQNGGEFSEMTKRLSEAKNARLEAEAHLEELKIIGTEDPERILDIGDYKKLEHIAKLLLDRSFKTAEFTKIRRLHTPNHPIYISFESDIEGLNESVASAGLAVAQTIRQRVETTKKHEENLQESLDQTKSEMLKAGGVMKEFKGLQRAVDAAYDTMHKLLARVNETTAEGGLSDQEITLKDPPLVPSKPIAPKKKVIVMIAGVLGGMLGLGIVLVLQLLDRSLRTRRQTEATLGMTVMAEIPEAFSEGNWGLKESLFVTTQPGSLVSEGFRALRTSLSTLSPRSLMITSASPDDGKTFCAVNLALLQAQFGYRTLLVDADFRKPTLAKILLDPAMGAQKEGAMTARNICQQTPYQNLSLITCSEFSAHTGESMSGEHFAAMLWEAYRSFDCVIIDSSPVGVVSDALSYAQYADAVMCVVRSGVTQTGDAQRMVQQLRRMRAPLAGVILNGVKETSLIQAQYHEEYAPAPRSQVQTLGMGVPQSTSH